jgi:UDP-N-acetylmuramoylalanine--D-glutamate ligase
VKKFSVRQQLENGVFMRGEDLIAKSSAGEQVVIKPSEMKLRGLHNVENVAAAVSAGLAVGASLESMRDTIIQFNPVEHRLEFVAELRGVKFYNDSKATSVDATLKALEAFAQADGKVVLIMGGRGKKAPYAPLAELIKQRVRKLVLIGEDAETIASELGEYSPVERASDMSDAVGRSFASSVKGDVVLLAPACASFDMFDSFEHRGRMFKAEISNLRSQISQ